jgi:hypothetical protein
MLLAALRSCRLNGLRVVSRNSHGERPSWPRRASPPRGIPRRVLTATADPAPPIGDLISAGISDPPKCRIAWDPGELGTYDLLTLMLYLHQIERDLVWPYVSAEMDVEPAEFTVSAIQMSSPLVIEVVCQQVDDLSVKVMALGTFGYLLKHPELISRWIAVVRGGARTRANESARRALYARRDYLRARAEFDVESEAVTNFENSYNSTSPPATGGSGDEL